jgi:hypothetical protein
MALAAAKTRLCVTCVSNTCAQADDVHCYPFSHECFLAAAHQAKMVGSSEYFRPLIVFMRCVMACTCMWHGHYDMVTALDTVILQASSTPRPGRHVCR